MSLGLWIVVVHWNQPERCARTLEQLRRQQVDAHVVVIDNGSEAGSVDHFRSLADEVVETGTNLGFGTGANIGLRLWLTEGDTEWCAVLPHDALPETGVIARILAEGALHPEAGLLCADVGDQASPTIDPFMGPLPGPAAVRDGFESVDYPHGTLMLVRRRCATEVGLFDERYFAYNEEADLGIRVRAAGWEVGLIRGAMVENPGQGNVTAVIDYLMLRNTIVMLREHFGLWNATFRTILASGQLVLGLVRKRRRAPWFNAEARVLAIRHAWSKRMGPPPESLG